MHNLGTILLVASLTVLSSTGCSSASPGAEGGDCQYQGGILDGRYSCNSGLVCNAGVKPKTCERPHINGVGSPCSQDDNCQVSLWCPLTNVCTPPLREGEPCPEGVGCAAGLVCKKEPAGPVCRVGS